MRQMLFKNRLEFRDWLTKNALSDVGVWLIFDKKGKLETLKANEALEEALCFGWIDGQMQSVDENSYIKYFKQRSKTSKWSEKNRDLAEKLELSGLMTDFGRAKIETAKQNGYWNPPKPEPLTDEQLQQFEDMLKSYESAYTNFIKMPRSARGAYAASYFLGAKSEEGKQKRLNTIIERLNLNLNPMESMKKKTENS
ncbi:MAG: YdeI/OmpD-associated family protein [Chitinophagales bacterium]